MKKIVLIISVFLTTSCATSSKDKYDWINPQGNIASPEEFQKVNLDCKYDESIEKASKEMEAAIMMGRYENQYGPKKSDENVKRASELVSTATNCVREKGFTTREKVKSVKKK